VLKLTKLTSKIQKAHIFIDVSNQQRKSCDDFDKVMLDVLKTFIIRNVSYMTHVHEILKR